jgi:hypothetical protein
MKTKLTQHLSSYFKQFLIVLTLASTTIGVSQTAKIEPEELNDIAYPVLSITKSASNKFLFLTLYGGRFLMYDISSSGNLLTKSSSLVWKNFNVEGFEKGGTASISEDGKTILVIEKRMATKVRVKATDAVILDAATGSIKLSLKNINTAQLINNGTDVLTCNDEGFSITNIASNKVTKQQAIDDCEMVCLNNAGNVLAVAFDPNRKTFKEVESVGDNKKELKNAIRNKKLVNFYEMPSFKKIGTCSDELDVVFTMQFTPKDEYVLLYTRNRTVEANQGKEQNNFIRIDSKSFKVDNTNFFYKSSDASAAFKYDNANNYFMYNDNEGFFEWKRRVNIYDFSEQNKKIASFLFQGKPKRNNLFSTAFCPTSSKNVVLANGTKIINWDIAKYPDYIDYIDRPDADALADSAVAQIQRDLENPESDLQKKITKKQIKGLFLFDLTIMKKGTVTGIYASSDDKTNIPMQNALKDILMKYEFDVKIPNNERIKIRQIINL